MQWVYRLTNRGRIVKLSDAPLSEAAGDCAALNGALPGYGMPEPRDALRLLHAGPDVELVDEETILISTARYGLLLTKRPPEA